MGLRTAAMRAEDDQAVRSELEALRRENAALRGELERAREQLAEQSENHNALIEGLPLFVFHKDLALRHIYVSENLARKLGLTVAEVEGRTDVELSGELGEKYQRDDRWVIETGQAFEDIEEHVPVDGEPTYIQTRKMPLRNVRGEIVGVQGWFFDVTPLKRAELALQARTGELEATLQKLRENQEQLLASEKMASLGRLTAGIAHEMNTPLAAVRSALSELGELIGEYTRSIGDADVGPDDHREIARDMDRSLTLAKNAAARASAFVRGIKAQTRNVTGQVPIDFDAVTVVGEALLLLGHLARAASCELIFESQLERCILAGVPGRLAQVVTNLVTNAIDACRDKGGGRITVALARGDGGAQLTVADQGSGIPRELLQRIFEPMFTTKPFGEGTGLGLSIVSDIVTAEFGGRIEVDSEPGRGTTFAIFLPERQLRATTGMQPA